jgi:hypothetical protein
MLSTLNSKDALLPALAGACLGAAVVYVAGVRPQVARVAELEREAHAADSLAQELQECGFKCQILKGGALEAAVPAERRPEQPSYTERPTVAEGELAVFVAPICPFAHRAWMMAVAKLGKQGFRAIEISLNR